MLASSLHGALLAYDLGLGKTIICITFMLIRQTPLNAPDADMEMQNAPPPALPDPEASHAGSRGAELKRKIKEKSKQEQVTIESSSLIMELTEYLYEKGRKFTIHHRQATVDEKGHTVVLRSRVAQLVPWVQLHEMGARFAEQSILFQYGLNRKSQFRWAPALRRKILSIVIDQLSRAVDFIAPSFSKHANC